MSEMPEADDNCEDPIDRTEVGSSWWNWKLLYRVPLGLVGASFVFLVTLAVCEAVWGPSDGKKIEEENENGVASGRHTVITEGAVGTRSLESIKRIVAYIEQNDNAAFQTHLAASAFVGELIKFKTGETVFEMDSSFWDGLIKVRREGELMEYWTRRDWLSH